MFKFIRSLNGVKNKLKIHFTSVTRPLNYNYTRKNVSFVLTFSLGLGPVCTSV